MKILKPASRNTGRARTSWIFERDRIDMEQKGFHKPVLLSTAADLLVVAGNGIYVDATTGGAGHSEEIVKRLRTSGRLVCLEADPDAIQYVEQRLSGYPNKIVRRISYDQLDVVLAQEHLLPVHGFLFDLGISSFQVDESARGFSFQKKGPLDMRFDPRQPRSAREVVNQAPLEQLERVFREYGEERQWQKIAEAIVSARQNSAIETTTQLVDIIRTVADKRYLNKTLARIFQALRIEVNDELKRLKTALRKAFECLEKGGRMVIISYHSLEDRMVKEFFKYKEQDCVCPPEFPQCVCDKVSEMRVVTRKAVRPPAREIKENPRARSARLRCAEKIVPYRSII